MWKVRDGVSACGPQLRHSRPSVSWAGGEDSRHGGRCRQVRAWRGGVLGREHWGAPFRGFLGRWFETPREPQSSAAELFLSLKITMCRS